MTYHNDQQNMKARQLLFDTPWVHLCDRVNGLAKGKPEHSIEEALRLTLETLRASSKMPAMPMDDVLPRVSVIVTLYNCASYVVSCVASIKAQSYRAIELILIDDCSTDSTYRTAMGMARVWPDIKVFQTHRNSGTYVAKNLGLIHASGRYITFQDCDDLSHPERIGIQLRALQSSTELIASTSQYARIDENTAEVLLNRGERARQGLISLMIDWPRVREKVGFFDSVRVNADDEYKTRIKKSFGAHSIVELPECLYYALLRQDGLTMVGHTANNIGSSDMKKFLAPVRQHYTAAFKEWHADTSKKSWVVEFPSVRRPFPAPVSIDAFFGVRFSALALLIEGRESMTLNLILERSAEIARRLITHVVIIDRRHQGELKGLPPQIAGIPLIELERQCTPDENMKQLADALAGGAVLLLDDPIDLENLLGDRLRKALYLMMSHRPKPVVVAFPGCAAACVPLEAIDVARVKFDGSRPDLIRSSTLTTLRVGGKLIFC